jgi:hypothetical protein
MKKLFTLIVVVTMSFAALAQGINIDISGEFSSDDLPETESPTVTMYCPNDYYYVCYVTMSPNEPSVIYYRVKCDDVISEWKRYLGTLFFFQPGYYTIEACAIAAFKSESPHVGGFFYIVQTPYPRGSVNYNYDIDISDVTLLIDKLLGKDVDIDLQSADTNRDGDISIVDVTELIYFLLNGNWRDETGE